MHFGNLLNSILPLLSQSGDSNNCKIEHFKDLCCNEQSNEAKTP